MSKKQVTSPKLATEDDSPPIAEVRVAVKTPSIFFL